MCHVIITSRTIIWTLLTICATLAMIAAVISPQWLIGTVRNVGLETNNTRRSLSGPDTGTYKPTIGIFNRCTTLHKFAHYSSDSCATYVTGFDMSDDEFPHAWKASLVFFCVAGAAMIFTVVTAVCSLCSRSIFGKSIFTVSGLIQSIAGLFSILALILYPAGWGSQRLVDMCGDEAGPFTIDGCSLGWCFYVGLGGTVLVFICAVLSISADSSTSCRKVEDQMLEGKNLICVL